jgi:chloramphenicol 3-O phosphotransferase
MNREAVPILRTAGRQRGPDAGIGFTTDGGVSIGPQFRGLENAWMEGVAAMARAGARVIVDDAFLGGAVSQQR